MSRIAVALLTSVIVAGNFVTIGLLLGERSSSARPDSGGTGGVGGMDVTPLTEAIQALRADVDRLSVALAERRAVPPVIVAPPEGDGAPAAVPAGGAPVARFDELLERLDRLESTLVSMKDANDELAAAKLREEREQQFRAEDGFTVADELLAQENWAVGANGILTFLDAHPDHPDARDLMIKARDAFGKAGYREKALWLQEEIMKKFPENRGADLYSRAMLEKQLRRYDEALGHIAESVELATNDVDRLNRMFYQAYLRHQRDGDAAGLAAYREVQRLSETAGYGVTRDEAGKRADEIESRRAER